MAALNSGTLQRRTGPLLLVVDAGNVAQRGIEKHLAHLELSFAQQRILTLVYFAEGSLTPTMLARRLLQETANVSSVLNRLEDRGLIGRIHDLKDRRMVRIALTQKGKEAAEEAVRASVAVSRELMGIMTGRVGGELTGLFCQVRDVGFRLTGERRRKA
jgi:DNA-binding MarR family transcriptional regulator